jgi:hypothetical protein
MVPDRSRKQAEVVAADGLVRGHLPTTTKLNFNRVKKNLLSSSTQEIFYVIQEN